MVVVQGRSLDTALAAVLPQAQPKDKGLVQALAYAAVRGYPQMDALLPRLLAHPLKRGAQTVRLTLILGLTQLLLVDMPAHAVVSECVAAVRERGFDWAAGLVNAILRRVAREPARWRGELCGDGPLGNAHPQWMLDKLRQDWPDDWTAIVTAGNTQGPMVLRVAGDREAYRAQLAAAGLASRVDVAWPDSALALEAPVPVEQLPGFAEGEVSVQDAGAQWAPALLAAESGMRVLDACAAPGGKTGHVLEHTAGLAEMVAMDVDERRLGRVRDTLVRLRREATVLAADAADVGAWWDGRPFERILLDAPCSGSGVIRRHPDIKLLRRAEDIPQLAENQRRLLTSLWPLLVPGGRLLYITCSVFREENEAVVQAFIEAHPDAGTLAQGPGRVCGAGHQILPGEGDQDGFFYAVLVKRGPT